MRPKVSVAYDQKLPVNGAAAILRSTALQLFFHFDLG
jgi:hypothetical protein